MIIKIVMIAIFLVAIIFFLGFIIHLCYLLITPSHKLSTDDFGKKNILYKYLNE